MTHASSARCTIPTPGRGLIDISARVQSALADSGMREGIAHVFTRHTSCSLLISENADPAVRADLERFFARLVPDGEPMFEHRDEGPDDMPAHVRAILTGASVTVPVHHGALELGTWQGIFLYEHRHRPHQRHITISFLGA